MKSIRGTRSPRRTAAALAVGGLLVSGLAATTAGSAQAAPGDPALKLLLQKGDLVAYGNDRFASLSLPVLVEAVGGDLNVKVTREPGAQVPGQPGSYANPIVVKRMVNGTAEVLPDAKVGEFWNGLEDFWHVTVVNRSDKTVVDQDMAFCPNSYDPQRIDPDSVDDQNKYPTDCFGQPFTLGATYGLSAGWAARASQWDEIGFPARLGRTFTVNVSVNPAYQSMFEGNPVAQSAQITVKRPPRDGGFKAAAKAATRHGVTSAGTTGRTATHDRPADPMLRPSQVATVAAPPTTALPDLRALPSSGIGISRRSGVQYLNFGATVWVGGNSRMDIEGFRDDPADPDSMTAYQYFYDGDTVVGKQPVGHLHFHRGGGHNHWHLDYFASYELVNADLTTVAKSGKQSFCLAPTDGVDLAMDGADLTQREQDLGSSCGSQDATWIRETLPVGWGDTYYQEKGGQAFDLKGVQPGTYYIRITANPGGELSETNTDNNISLRKVVIGRRADGTKTVCVPAVDGLDGQGLCK